MELDFLYILKAIIIAIVEGLTEFVPVSSTGHMILVGSLIGFREGASNATFAAMFEVVIQLGAILAVVVLYWNKLWGAIVEFFTFIFTKGKKGEQGFKFGINVIIASIPAMIFGLTLYDWIKDKFKPSAVVVGFIVGGVLLLVVEHFFRNKVSRKGAMATTDVFDLTPMQALKVGLFQCISMWPGMSRSASTIMGGWIAGIATPAAAEFSFFLAIPAMVGSSGLELLNFDYSILNSTYIVALIVGFVVAFLVSLLVMEAFVSFLKKRPMRIFAIYRIIAGIVLLGLSIAGIVTLTL